VSNIPDLLAQTSDHQMMGQPLSQCQGQCLERCKAAAKTSGRRSFASESWPANVRDNLLDTIESSGGCSITDSGQPSYGVI
jgi:hypothetical protein